MPAWFTRAAVLCGLMFATTPILVALAPYEREMGLVQISDSAIVDSRANAAYSAAKAGVVGFTRALAVEFGRKVLFSTERPSFIELENHVKRKPAQ